MLSRQQKKVLSHRQVQMESLELRALLTGACIDFESLTMGAVYHVGDAFVADPTGFQAKISGEPFTTSIGSVITTGRAIVVGTGLAGDTGLELSVNNIVLDFDFNVAGSLPGLKLSFGEYGGNLNLEINGDFRNFNNFQDVDGTIIGGTFVTVPTGGLGNDKGVLYVDGQIDSFKIGGQEFALDHVCTDDSFTGATFDWGDAPEKPYRTRAIANGAVHRIEPGVYLGRRVDAEPDGQPTAMADGDDAALVLHPDDEDGVTFLGAIVPGSTANVEVVASTKGVLNAWIDFNRDGQWSSGAPEQVFVSKLLSAGVNTLSFTVPKDAVVDSKLPTFSRWRFSTSHSVLEPIDGVVINGERLIPNGEVEDHVVFIQPAEPTENYDFGDAPDKPYPTLLVHNGARHVVDPNFYLGAGVDSETDGRPNRTATGDDLLGGDEDGVTFMTPLVAGRTARIRVVASQPGKLDAWIDYDADGKWEPHEAIASSLSVNKGDNFLSITVPPWAVDGTTFSRFRLSRLGGLSPVGAAPDGEVEDHLVTIEGRQPTVPAEPTIELATNSEQGSSGIVIFPEPTFANVDAAGQEWTQMFSAGAESLLGKVGTPAVPVLRRLIAVPAGASVTASLQEAPKVVQTWQVNLMPIQPAAPDVDEAPPDSVFDDPSGFAYDAELYASQVSYPNYGIKVTPIGKLRDLEVAIVEIPTANYTPATGELNVFGEVKWKVEFAGGKGFLPENSANPFENSDSQYDLVLNRDIIRERLYPGDVNAFAGEELLILTHPDFREAADKLAEWKRDKGIMTSVYEVGMGTPYDTSDEIKNLIQVRYDNTVVRASYVLLLGDAEFIPTFYRHSYYSGGTGGPNIELNQDYFGGTWNPYGTINFNADGTEYIDVVRKTREYDVTDTGATVADAIRLVHVDSGTEVIVDNLSPGFSTISGTWTESAATDEYNGSSLISYDDEARARFTPTLTKPGLYQVYARWSNMSGLTPINRDSEALLNVVSNSTGTDTPYTFLSGGLIDLLPDVANGRIPVDTLPDAMTVVDKIIA
ncbi:MAG: hypothetical protein KDB23_15595, partial [Planctomycetales bacterium]|nr:hypothetical protein [Planctomycetales bacterium]